MEIKLNLREFCPIINRYHCSQLPTVVLSLNTHREGHTEGERGQRRDKSALLGLLMTAIKQVCLALIPPVLLAHFPWPVVGCPFCVAGLSSVSPWRLWQKFTAKTH